MKLNEFTVITRLKKIEYTGLKSNGGGTLIE